MYYAEEKKRFKAGWQSMRNQSVIQQDKERLQNTVVKEQRESAIKELKAERTVQCQNRTSFNPITGQGKEGLADTTSQFRQTGVRPEAMIKQMEASTRPDPRLKAERAAAAAETRRHRIANEGLAYHTQRGGGSTAACLNWQS